MQFFKKLHIFLSSFIQILQDFLCNFKNQLPPILIKPQKPPPTSYLLLPTSYLIPPTSKPPN